jgi:hypothetical protein
MKVLHFPRNLVTISELSGRLVPVVMFVVAPAARQQQETAAAGSGRQSARPQLIRINLTSLDHHPRVV